MDEAPDARHVRVRAEHLQFVGIPGETSPRVEVDGRPALPHGDRVALELSFGALVDEVELTGVSLGGSCDSAGRSLRVALDQGQREQVRYVLDVLGGDRPASARGSRRMPSSLPVEWSEAKAPVASVSSNLHDISRGGAFVLARKAPRVGSQVQLELRSRHHAQPLRVTSVVSWVRAAGRNAGFGVRFKPSDSAVACALAEVVREHELT